MEGTPYIEAQEEQSVNIRDIFRKSIRHWYWFAIGLVLALIAARLYVRYATPVYQVDAVLLIKDDKGPGGSNMQNDILSQLTLITGSSNVQNEMAILQSRTLIERVVRDLHLQTNYYVEGRVKKTALYKRSPIEVTPVFLKDSGSRVSLEIMPHPEQNSYTLSDEKSKVTVSDGKIANLASGSFLVRSTTLIPDSTKDSFALTHARSIEAPDPNPDTTYKQIQVVVSPMVLVVNSYKNKLALTQTDKTSSVIQLSIKTPVPERGEDFLNSLLLEYGKAGRADKNEMAANTVDFVDIRLDSITDELNTVEGRLQNFMSRNGMANIDEQSKLFLDQASQLDQQLTTGQMQLDMLQQIQKYVSQPEKAHDLVPSSLGIQDPTLLSLIQQYNGLQLQRSQQVQSGALPNNPLIKTMDHQINELKNNISENVQNLQRGMQASINNLKQQNKIFESKIRSVPGLQRDYITIKRQQDIKQTLYIYLLQKREEASITEAASVSNSRIIDPAKTIPQPVAPKSKLIYLAAILLGLGLPGGLLYLKETLSRKISSRQEIESRTEVPIFAEIGHSPKDGPLIVLSGVRSPVAEQFRNLRTNLNFVLGTGENKKTVLITSSMSGEGKSFISLNLAMTYALLGKRTVLLDLDLRRPKLGRYLDQKDKPGISNFLAGEKSMAELPSELSFGQQNLHFINSGPVPPNPAELLLQPAMDELISWLKENYDYVLLDTPPIGLVTDAQVLGKYADASLYIIRHGFTFKEQVDMLDKLHKEKKLSGLGIVLNDIKAGDSYRYGYGGYGYGYGYYSDNGEDKNKSNSSVYKKIKESLKGD